MKTSNVTLLRKKAGNCVLSNMWPNICPTAHMHYNPCGQCHSTFSLHMYTHTSSGGGFQALEFLALGPSLDPRGGHQLSCAGCNVVRRNHKFLKLSCSLHHLVRCITATKRGCICTVIFDAKFLQIDKKFTDNVF